MIKDLVIYPDARLREVSKEIVEFDGVTEILDNMYETMIEKGGVGLAGVQIGVLKRVLIANPPREDKIQYKEDLLEIINPIVLEKEGEIIFQEGCLSIPGYFEEVSRFNFIKIKFLNRFKEEKILTAEGYLAVIIQHEIDHLNGALFIDKLSFIKRKKFEKEYKAQD